MKIFGWVSVSIDFCCKNLARLENYVHFQGANTYGQLGLGYKCEQLVTPTDIPFGGEKIISITGGAGHSLALTENGSVYSTGWNAKGQLGYEHESATFKKITALENHKIVQIACGWDFSAAVTETGQAFTWGSNAFLQIGLKSTAHTTKPTSLEFHPRPVKHISCGMRHMAVIFEDDHVWTSGDGSKGQLGIIDADGNVFRKATVPVRNRFVAIACGQHHNVALSIDGDVYIWGDNKHGQLGFDPAVCKKILTPKKLENVNVSVEKVFAGWTHTALLTTDGEVYNFGRNTYGQLGEERARSWLPEKLNVDNLKCLSLGSEHNLAVNRNGKVFSWGWNEHGNCGTGDVEDKNRPQRVLIDNAVQVSAGTGQSFAITIS